MDSLLYTSQSLWPLAVKRKAMMPGASQKPYPWSLAKPKLCQHLCCRVPVVKASGISGLLIFGIRPNETTPSLSDWCCLPAGVNLVHVGCIIEQDSAACALHTELWWKELKSPTWRHQTLHIPLYCSHMAADLIFFLPQLGIKLATNLDCERRH